jgi:hypothetical protein
MCVLDVCIQKACAGKGAKHRINMRVGKTEERFSSMIRPLGSSRPPCSPRCVPGCAALHIAAGCSPGHCRETMPGPVFQVRLVELVQKWPAWLSSCPVSLVCLRLANM